MPDAKYDIKRIQQITNDACKSGGRLSVLLEDDQSPPELLAEELELAATRLEQSAVELRKLCETLQHPFAPMWRKASLKAMEVAGHVEENEFGWLHIQLNTLLPHCRFTTPLWLTDTITRLLDEYEQRRKPLSMMDKAVLVIDEHCDVDARQVFDQDNKGWKAVSNALKGRLFPDDDQFTLGVCLMSRRTPGMACHIYVLPEWEVGDFFSLRSDDYPIFR